MSIGQKLLLNTAVTILFLVILVLVSYFSIHRVQQDIRQLAEVEGPLEEAILELEINANETALAVFDYLMTPTQRDLERIADSEKDFTFFVSTFEKVAKTDEERAQSHNAAEKYKEFKDLGLEIIGVSKRRFDDLQKLRADRSEIDKLIDEKIQPSIDESLDGAFEKLNAALEIKNSIDDAFSAVEGYMVQQDAALERKARQAVVDFRRSLAQYRSTRTTVDEDRWLASIDSALTGTVESGNRILSGTDLLHEKLAQFRIALEDFDRFLDEDLQAPVRERALRAAASAQASGEAAIVITIVVGFLIIGVMACVSWFVSRGIIRGIGNLSDGVTEFGLGNLHHRIELQTKDELGRLAVAFNTMAERRTEDEEALKSSEEWLRTAFEVVTVGLIVIDENGLIESFNKAAVEIFGYDQEEVIGKNVKMLMPEPYVSEHDTYLHNYKSTADRKIIGIGREVMGLRKNGEIFPMHLGVGETRTNNRRSFVGSTIDLTERKKLERMKSEFVSTVSHELRTPLTSIKGSLGLIGGGALGEIPDKAEELLDLALRNTERLVNLVNDILLIESLESGKVKFTFSPLDLQELVSESVKLNVGFANQFGVNFVVADNLDEAMVWGDSNRIVQVLANLLSNAAKFSPKGGSVTVSVVRQDATAKVLVSDNGPGIPEAFRDRIFSKFAQADSSDSREKGGTGLGLNISQTIIEEHGGTIGFDSEEGAGTTFYFTLPVLREGQAYADDSVKQAS